MYQDSLPPPFLLALFLFILFSFSSLLFAAPAVRAPAPSSSAISSRAFNPPSLEAGQVGRTLYSQGANLPGITAEGVKPTPQPLVPSSEVAKQNAQAAKITFVLNGVRFIGNHVFSSEILRKKIFSSYIHKKISIAKLIELVTTVTQLYQNEGYFLSRALLPQQQIKNGVVTIQIIEGFISHVEVKNAKYLNKEFIEKYGRAIAKSKPAKLNQLERYLLLLNDIPGIQVKSLIAPDPRVPLGAHLTLVTDYTPLSIAASRDNYQTRYLGPLENSAYGAINSFLIPGNALYWRALASNPINKLQYYEIKNSQVIGTSGLAVGVDAYYTQNNPQFILTPLDVVGFSGDGNIFANYPVLRSRERNLHIQGQLDYLNNHSNALEQLLYYDRLRTLTLSAQYDDLLWKGQDSLYIGLVEGFKILGVTDQMPASRLGGDSAFIKFNATLSRLQAIFGPLSVYGLVTTQWSNRILLAPEVFTFGGPSLGRGYDFAQFTSDEGVAGTVEVRMDTNPSFPFLKQMQYYYFYDLGQFWNHTDDVSFTGQANTASVNNGFIGSGASMGLGIRGDIIPHVHLDGYVGKPLTTPNATQIILGRNGHALLWYFQITLSS